MCTSFIKATKDNCFISMNFDNNGMKYRISTRKKDWFIVYIDTGKVTSPSFGMNKSGVFFNNLVVDPCDNGKYQRKPGVVHSTKFLHALIDGNIYMDDLESYLQSTKIVNVPDWSTHNMLCGPQNNVWILEPGRGHLHTLLKPDEFKVMTNFSLIDSMQHKGTNSCDRYQTAEKLLSDAVDMNVTKAFDILQAVKQREGEWITTVSMVYDRALETIYYCENQDFKNIKEYHF